MGAVDSLILRFDAVRDDDLMLCHARGIGYQRDMTKRVSYDEKYMRKFSAYNTTIAGRVNAGRCALVGKYVRPGASVIDVGAGSGAWVRDAVKAGFDAKGCDVNAEAIKCLLEDGLYSFDTNAVEAVTFWDSLEHMEDPQLQLKAVAKGAHAFVSLPIFGDLRAIRSSKHYRPGEHLYYHTRDGFVDWMALYGYRLLEESDHETDAGREAIGAFAFVKDLPDYHDHIGAYQQMHASRHYGGSSTELHLEAIGRIVRDLAPHSILDYGCGRSDLVAHFWRDGERRIGRYDPAIPAFKTMPEGTFDLVLCCDVLEHVPMFSVDRVLREIREKSQRAVFTISTKPSRAKLPDGRNAHVTLLNKGEWTRWLQSYFGRIQEVGTAWEHELLMVAG